MLISPPFLLPRNVNESDADFVARCMPDTSVMVAGTQAPEGAFPVSFKLGWHGGRHLEAPVDANGVVLDVRAIADGEIVYARRPTPRNANPSPAEPRNYNPYGDAPAWTDDGCVIVRHTTEIGADAQNQPVEVSFLSIYMHLSELRGAAHRVAAGGQDKAVYRKDEIGVAGMLYGNDRQLHLEIICDDVNLEALIGRLTGALSTAVDGRTDVIFGELYFRLPAGTPFFGQRPGLDEITPVLPPAHVLQSLLYVGLRYAGGDGAQGHRGDAWLTSYDEDGVALGDPLNEGDAEYELYRSANDISNAYPTNARPAPSAVYELLRFGRVIGPDPLVPVDVPHWREVRYPGGQGWVNLNAGDVRKFSDADFPEWRGWRLIDDDVDGDSRCESADLIGLIEDSGAADGKLQRAELERRLQLPPVRERLARTICKVPGEWDRASARARWGWLVGDPEFGLDASDFGELIAHIEALTFPWAATGVGIGATHWHWDPRAFIACWRHCGWISPHEFAQCIPRRNKHLIRSAFIEQHVASWRAALSRAQRWSLPLSIAARKFILPQSPLRLLHFFAQCIEESGYLQLVVEGGGPSASYAPWYGRGLIQLTHLANYLEYGRFRGWATQQGVGVQYVQLGWDPDQRLASDDFACADSAGFYWVSTTINAISQHMNIVADNGVSPVDVLAVSRGVNGNVSEERVNGLDVRIQLAVFIKYALLDELRPTAADPKEAVNFRWRNRSRPRPYSLVQHRLDVLLLPQRP